MNAYTYTDRDASVENARSPYKPRHCACWICRDMSPELHPNAFTTLEVSS